MRVHIEALLHGRFSRVGNFYGHDFGKTAKCLLLRFRLVLPYQWKWRKLCVSKINGPEMILGWQLEVAQSLITGRMRYTICQRQKFNSLSWAFSIQHSVITAIYLNGNKTNGTNETNKPNENRQTPKHTTPLSSSPWVLSAFPWCWYKCSWLEMIHRNKVDVISINATATETAPVAPP